jgi:hypothetical protein
MPLGCVCDARGREWAQIQSSANSSRGSVSADTVGWVRSEVGRGFGLWCCADSKLLKTRLCRHPEKFLTADTSYTSPVRNGIAYLFMGSALYTRPMFNRTGVLLSVLLLTAAVHGHGVSKTKSNLTACAEKACNVLIYGDSFTICDYVNCHNVGPVTSTNRWAEQIRIDLQRRYGNGGTGIIPVNVGYVLGRFNNLNAEAWTCSGPYDFDTSYLHVGPMDSKQGQYGVLHMGSGAVCAFHDSRSIAWRTLETYYVSSSGTLTASIDGKPAQVVTVKSSKPRASINTTMASEPGTHTVIYRSSGDSYLYGAEGRNGQGVSVHNLAISGSNSQSINSPEKLAFTRLIPNGIQQTVLAHYTNDVSARATTYTNDLRTAIAFLKPSPILLVIPPVTSMYPSGAQQSYTSEILALCNPPAIDCVNIQDRWGTTYSNAERRWNGVHPNDKGNLEEGAIIYSRLQ